MFLSCCFFYLEILLDQNDKIGFNFNLTGLFFNPVGLNPNLIGLKTNRVGLIIKNLN